MTRIKPGDILYDILDVMWKSLEHLNDEQKIDNIITVSVNITQFVKTDCDIEAYERTH